MFAKVYVYGRIVYIGNLLFFRSFKFKDNL